MTQPLDTAAIQAALTLLGTAPWRTDGPEIYTDDPDSPHASTWIGETCSIELPDGGAARAEAIVTVHNALPALLAHVADLEQQLAAAPLNGWATALTTAGLEPYDGSITLDGDDQPFARIHLAFHPDMDDTDRNEFLTTLGRVVLRAL